MFRAPLSKTRRKRRLLVSRQLRVIAATAAWSLCFLLVAARNAVGGDEIAPCVSTSTAQQFDEGKPPATSGAVVGQDVAKQENAKPEYVELLTEDLTEHWKQFSSVPAAADAPVWKMVRGEDGKELTLVCSGEPKGYLHTTDVYADFELTLEWKYPVDADGNSGVLVYTQLEPRIWPTSMQVQLHQPKVGSVFPSGDAMSDQSSEAEPELARPVDTWNECKIHSHGGRLTVEVNGKKAGEVSGAKPFSGCIALQSEGSAVHFRRIRIRKLAAAEPKKNDEPTTAPTQPATTQCVCKPKSLNKARRAASRHVVARRLKSDF